MAWHVVPVPVAASYRRRWYLLYRKLKIEGRSVLHNNYESLFHSHTMQQQLNNVLQNDPVSVRTFEDALTRQADNLSEAGEKKFTNEIREHYFRLRAEDTTQRAQKGKIWVDSEIGKGSSFSFMLPVGRINTTL